MNWKSDRSPFLLKPVGKDYLWGGSRLRDDFSKEIDLEPLAESWECSTHPDGLSMISSGAYAGSTLLSVLEQFPELAGTHPNIENGLPVLVKFIDARQDLSVQVHPDDAYAREYENGSLGKTEMWYVLDATKDTKLVYGFHHNVTKESLRKSIANGTVEKHLQYVPIQKDDVFFIPAGQVHAIGSGALIAEVQQNSNLTYRLYDYGRVDKFGLSRPLHIEKALDVANLSGSAEPRQPMRVLRFQKGKAEELLCRCKYFQVHRILLNTERIRGLASIQTGSNSFQVLLCTKGCGVLFWNGGMLNFFRGDCIFIPALSPKIKIHGKAQLLRVEC